MPPRKGLPIGNLTSQIFANIYLNEFDRFVTHQIKPLAYLRYGDDFIILTKTRTDINAIRENSQKFLFAELRLSINPKNDIIIQARQGLHFLGVDIFPKGRRLNKRNTGRLKQRLDINNAASYYGFIRAHSNVKSRKALNWAILEQLEKFT